MGARIPRPVWAERGSDAAVPRVFRARANRVIHCLACSGAASGDSLLPHLHAIVRVPFRRECNPVENKDMRVLDRTSELAALREIAARGPPAFLVVCGRRRVGKSCLRDHVWHDRRVFCYLSANAPAEFNQRELLRDLADGAGREFVARDYPTWQAGFRIGSTAEEVVQETWLGVLRGLERCAALVAQDTWLFRILLNRAKTRAQREGRTTGRRGRGIGATRRKSGSSPGRREHASTRPSPCCRPASGRCSSCATSRAGPPRRPVTCWRSARRINACYSTAHGRRCAGR
jgi:hypothetical protein